MTDNRREVTLLDPVDWGKAGFASLTALFGSGLLNMVSLRIAVISPERRYLYVNNELLDFFNLRAEQLIGRRIREVWDERMELAFCEDVFDQALTGQTLRRVGWFDYPSGDRCYLQETLMPFKEQGGTVEAVVVLVRDDTQLKLREAELAQKLEELKASEALKSAIFDHSPNALVSTDEQGRIVEFNPAAEAMFGYQRKDVLGRTVSEVLIPQRYRATHEAGLRRQQSGGGSRVLRQRLQLDALRADGSELPIEMSLWRTKVADAVFYTAFMADLTERHNAARQRDALRQSEKLTAMGGLLAGVAHELNNPLSIAMGRASLLEEKCEDADIKADAKRIREATERCGRIVRTFLNMARGKSAQRTAVNLNDVVRAAIDMLHYTFRTHGVDIACHLATDLPAAFADADQIAQVVVNLLVNAQQALDGMAGARRIAIQTGIAKSPQDGRLQVWMRVSDSGPGVSPEMMSDIFEPFVTTKAEDIGTGLGLPVSRSLARAHGGDLTVEANGVLGGASFLLSLPVSGDTFVHLDIQGIDHADQAPSVARVLIVDDEPELVSMMREMLEGAGYEVITAESAAVALELTHTARVDVVISDFRMPDTDGATLWKEIQRHHPSLAARMIFVSGDTLSPNARAFLEASRCPWLDKPFTKTDLLSRVKQMIEQDAQEP